MSQHVVPLWRDLECERAVTTRTSAHVALARCGGSRPAAPARTSAEHDLHDNFVFALTEADAEFLLQAISPASHHSIEVIVVDFRRRGFCFVVVGLFVVLGVRRTSRACRLGVGFLGGGRGGGGIEVCASSPLTHIRKPSGPSICTIAVRGRVDTILRVR